MSKDEKTKSKLAVRLRAMLKDAASFEDEPEHAVFTYSEVLRMICEAEEWIDSE